LFPLKLGDSLDPVQPWKVAFSKAGITNGKFKYEFVAENGSEYIRAVSIVSLAYPQEERPSGRDQSLLSTKHSSLLQLTTNCFRVEMS
jgi:hypothetical protein